MRKVLLILTVAVFLFSCSNENKKAENKQIAPIDTLSYTYDSVKVLSKNVIKANNKVSDTTKALISYPIFKSEKLNTAIKRQVLNYFSPEEPNVISYQDIAKSFVNGYDDFYESNKSTFQSWYLTIEIKVLQQQKDYLSLQYTHSDYVGGAHGMSMISYFNYNPQTEQIINLEELIPKEKTQELLKIAESVFRKNEGLDATASLEDKYFFEQGKFSLPPSFHVNNEGLVFVYNPYEIKPYASGRTTLLLSFAELKDIAKEGTILKP